MTKRISKTEKILGLINGIILETGAFLYPYKGFGRQYRRYRGSLAKAIANLKRYGYLEEVELKGQRSLQLTKKGLLKIWQPNPQKDWDGRWRIVAFDIPEKRRKTRDLLRTKLSFLGFKFWQKSLWICPYDVSEEIEELLDLLNLEEEVDYFVAEALTKSAILKEMFDLE